MINRRRFAISTGVMMAGWGATGIFPATGSSLATGSSPATGRSRAAGGDAVAAQLAAAFARIEGLCRGRLGVAVLDTQPDTGSDTGADLRIGLNSNARFPLCSTFKLLLVAAVLARVDGGRERLERRLRFGAEHLVAYSPVTERRTGEPGMSIAQLCEAAMTWSDNTAANLLLAILGGPAAITAFARSLGDPVTRLDRIEPDLNEAAPGDPRDTTSPAAMAENLRKLACGDALSERSRDRFVSWLVANRTGQARLRAGLPRAWRVGDKTGGGGRGTSNDVAIAWPPGRAPVIIAAYVTESSASAVERDIAIAAVGQAVADSLSG